MCSRFFITSSLITMEIEKIIKLIASIIGILVFVTGKNKISDFFKIKINSKKVIVYIIFFISVLIISSLIFGTIFSFFSNRKTQVVSDTTKIDDKKKKDSTKEKIVSIDTTRIKKTEQKKEKKIIIANSWPIYKGNLNDEPSILFSIEKIDGVYTWTITNAETLNSKIVHESIYEPSSLLYNSKTNMLYYIRNGRIKSANWSNLDAEHKTIKEIPNRDSFGQSKYFETDLWIDKDTGKLRFAVMGSPDTGTDDKVTFLGEDYIIQTDENGRSKYCDIKIYSGKNIVSKRIYIGVWGTLNVIDIREFDGEEWNYITGSPTKAEADDTKGFLALDFIINNNSDYSYVLNSLKLDKQCAEPNKCFDFNTTFTLERKLSNELRINDRFNNNSEFQNVIGKIKLNNLHELYFPIIRAGVYYSYQSIPLVITSDHLKNRITLSWDYKNKVGNQLFISTTNRFILVQSEHSKYMGAKIIGLLFDSNKNDGKPIKEFKGNNTIFLPKIMADAISESL